MEKFVCKNCNYRFESSFAQDNKSCPYCGRKELIKEPNAEELVGD